MKTNLCFEKPANFIFQRICSRSAKLYVKIVLGVNKYVTAHGEFQTSVDIVLYCGRVPAANAPACTAADGLLYKPWSLVFHTCTARCLYQRP